MEQSVAMMRGVPADMVWMWMQSENLTKVQLYGFIMHVAQQFHEAVGYCLVYHGNIFMAEELKLEEVLDAIIRCASMPRGLEDVERQHEDRNLPPPTVPDSDDDDALSFEDAAAESDCSGEADFAGQSIMPFRRLCNNLST